MTVNYTKNLEAQIYKDDFDPDKGFHKVLFKSGKALQSRELNQLQSIIQEEIKRLGTNLFKEGASLESAALTFNNRYRYIKLNTDPTDATTPGVSLPSNVSNFKDKVFVGQLSGISVKVIEIVEAEGSDPATIYVQYLDTLNGTSGTEPASVTPGEELLEKDGSVVLVVQTTDTTADPATGYGFRISTGAASFFAEGHFVHAPKQSLIVAKYFSNPTATIGFKLTQVVTTADDDDSLYDNQGDLPNYTAPGADRYTINLELVNKNTIQADETFIYYAKIEHGFLVEAVTGYDQYNKINDIMAVRTKEESGNYTVKPFRLSWDEHSSDNTKLSLGVSSGTAYVNGYRVSKASASTLDIPRSTTTITQENKGISGTYGNYILVEAGFFGIPDVNIFERVDISDDTTGTAAFGVNDKIGTLRIRGIDPGEPGSNTFKVYVFDIEMNAGKIFNRDARAIGLDSGACSCERQEMRLVRSNNKVIIYETQANELFFKIPGNRPSAVSDISMTLAKRYRGTAAANGSMTITASAGEVFTDTANWIISDPGGLTTGQSPTYSGVGTSSVTITGLVSSKNGGTIATGFDQFEVYAYTFKGACSVASKTKVTTTALVTFNPSTGVAQLPYTDVIGVEEIRILASNGNLVTDKFEIDGGQRDNSYQKGSITIKPGRTITGNYQNATLQLFVKFSYFAHGSGDFFGPSSYSTIDYQDIPNYQLANGRYVDLKNYLDFRSSKGSSGTYSTTDAEIFILPKQGSTIVADVSYYQPRYDKLVLTQQGEFKYIKGTPSLNPKFPSIPDGTMELHRIRLNAGTFGPDDLTFSMLDNKRYTMRDIGKLERKIDDLAEVTSLTLLEMDTANIDVLDSDNRNRTKSGFMADNFENQYFSDITHPGYSAAIDPRNKLIRPRAITNNIGLYYDSNASTNTIMKGDNVYTTYNTTPYIVQDVASSTVNVNPYLNLFYNGAMTLSPASDDWYETDYTPDKIIPGGTLLNTDLALQWGDHEWNWGGTDINDLKVGDDQSITSEIARNNWTERVGYFWNRKTTTGTDVTKETVVNRVVASETVREIIDDRIVDVAFIPFMRSKLVTFQAEGLAPNTQVFAYFDGRSVAKWVRQESFSGVNVTKQTDVSNLYKAATEYPLAGGKTKLYTDGQGKIQGAFFIPSSNTRTAGTTNFRTGDIEFTLLDITEFNKKNASCAASAIFSSTGTLTTRQEDVLSTRLLHIVGTSTTSTETINVSSSGGGGGIDILGAVNTVGSGIATGIGEVLQGDLIGGVSSAVGGVADAAGDLISDTVGVVEDVFNFVKDICFFDPIAQSFLVTEANGVFLTEVGLFFAKKDTSEQPFPVTIQIRPTVNGHPSSDLSLPGSIVTIPASDVVVSTDASAETRAVFKEPVYLKPFTEYAIVVISNSDAYEAYISKMGEFKLGSTTEKINTQPYLGSFFKSQNNRTWEPDQMSDLKFTLYKAEFNANLTTKAIFKNVAVPRKILQSDPVELFFKDSSDFSDVYIRSPLHGLYAGDTVNLNGVIGTPVDSDLNNNPYTITEVDPTGFVITVPTLTSPSPYYNSITGGSAVTVEQAYNYSTIWPSVQAIEPPSTRLDYNIKMAAGKSYADNSSNAINNADILDTVATVVAPNQDNELGVMKRVSPPSKLATSMVLEAEMKSSNVYVTPVIDLQRTSATLITNLIDNPSNVQSTTQNKPIEWSHALDSDTINSIMGTVNQTASYNPLFGETRENGPASAKHITKPVRLAASAVGLKIIMGANRPSDTFIDMYYRASKADTLVGTTWTRIDSEKPVQTDDDTSIFREYRYLVGAVDGTSDEFTQFQLKIVLRSTNQTKVPKLNDLRVIALGD